jgi:hypothetical protein
MRWIHSGPLFNCVIVVLKPKKVDPNPGIHLFFYNDFSNSNQYIHSVSSPLSKFSRWKCSFGAWKFSVGSPNPINTIGACKTLSRVEIIGNVPPPRVNEVGTLYTCS